MKRIFILLLLLWTCLSYAKGKSTITDSYNAEIARNYTRALQIMDELRTDDPEDEFYLLRTAWLQYLLGNYKEAEKNYNKSNQIFRNLDAQTGILNCYLALGKWSDAKTLADQILKSYPQNTLIMSKAAYAAYMQQNYRATADYYLEIIKLAPWDMESRGYLVNNLYLSKDTENARKHYNILKKYSPDSPMVKEYSSIFK